MRIEYRKIGSLSSAYFNKAIGQCLIFLLVVTMHHYSIAWAQNSDQAVAISNGTNWLIANKQGALFWGLRDPANAIEVTEEDLVPTYLRDTLEAVTALQVVSPLSPDIPDAITWIELQNVSYSEYVARKIKVFVNQGIDTTKEVATLLSRQNPDGGFGGAAGYPSNVLDTAMALQGLAVSGSADATTISQAVSYLLSSQNADGGFGFVKGEASRVYYTALVMQALETQSKTTSVANSLSKAATYLISKQQAGGSWGNVADTSLAFQALTRSTLDLISRSAAISYLTSSQLPDGSWDEDPYSTALALRALSDSGIISSAQINPINLTKVIDGISQPASTYSAYETMTIGVTTADPDALLEVTVQDSSGTIFSTRTEGGEIFFDTQNLAPGTYTIIVLATDQNTGIIIDEERFTFTIRDVKKGQNYVLQGQLLVLLIC
ncbi:MAG: hypothetical protein HZA13_07770 [Nitrospirae bacterium]|nr:hypothetical protein [Nitrospirota bacterium]